jgi:hypothetical protein
MDGDQEQSRPRHGWPVGLALKMTCCVRSGRRLISPGGARLTTLRRSDGFDPTAVCRRLDVRSPRLDEVGLRIDASLDEPQWKQAATLTGFSQFSPRDGIPAEDSTEVFVWYSPTAIHFGVRAYEPHGAVHATLGDRDKIFSDDRIELLIGTFHDGRQAVVLGVNPLGVQMDGTLVENNQARGGGSGGSTNSREFPDLSPTSSSSPRAG